MGCKFKDIVKILHVMVLLGSTQSYSETASPILFNINYFIAFRKVKDRDYIIVPPFLASSGLNESTYVFTST